MTTNTTKYLFLFLLIGKISNAMFTEIMPSLSEIEMIQQNCLIFFEHAPKKEEIKLGRISNSKPRSYFFCLDNVWYKYEDLSGKTSGARNSYYYAAFHHAQNKQNNIEIIAFMNEAENPFLITKKEGWIPFNFDDYLENE